MGEVVMAADWREGLARESHARRKAAIDHAADTARRLCPIDTGALVGTIEGVADDTSMGMHLKAGSESVDYALIVELGGRPHEIRSHGPYPLRNRETGQVFGPVVHHPGTPAQPYLRPGVMSIGEIS